MLDHKEIIDRVNKERYERKDILKHYEGEDYLCEPERALFVKLLPSIKDKKLLDIGVGAGRTTRFLLEISRDYTGINYSLGFVELAREKYKGSDIRH